MAVCPECGSEYREGMKYCEDCNRDLVAVLTEQNVVHDTSEVGMVALKTFSTSAEAEMVQEVLTQSGIRSLLQGESSTDIFPTTAVATVLLVDERDAVKASEIVNAYFEAELEEVPEQAKED